MNVDRGKKKKKVTKIFFFRFITVKKLVQQLILHGDGEKDVSSFFI